MKEMRLLKDVVPELKKIDPLCPLTTYSVRNLGRQGKIRTVPLGSHKILYDLDSIVQFLNGTTGATDATGAPGTVRRIS